MISPRKLEWAAAAISGVGLLVALFLAWTTVAAFLIAVSITMFWAIRNYAYPFWNLIEMVSRDGSGLVEVNSPLDNWTRWIFTITLTDRLTLPKYKLARIDRAIECLRTVVPDRDGQG